MRAVGTLCRVIPLDTIGGKVVKYRVEHGDVGAVLGVVMFDLAPHPEGQWKAWYVPMEDRFDPGAERLIGRFFGPEAAALRLAAERFVQVPEQVATFAMGSHREG